MIFAWIAEIFNYLIGVIFVTIMFSIMQSFKQMRTLDEDRWLHHQKSKRIFLFLMLAYYAIVIAVTLSFNIIEFDDERDERKEKDKNTV